MGITENLDEFVAVYHNNRKDIDMYQALAQIMETENIRTKQDLDEFCGKARDKLYNRVRNISQTHWDKLKDPKASIRAKYETILKGYKLYNEPH